jgi:hypothetical protein
MIFDTIAGREQMGVGQTATNYPRCLTQEFLDRCHPRQAEFFRYWDSKRRGRRMPARIDIVPADLTLYLPDLIIVDVRHDPLHLTYRFVGVREIEYRGYDPTGKDVSTHFVGRSRDEVLLNYRLAIEHRSFVYDEDPVFSADGRFREVGTLLLPVSDDDETVSMVLIHSTFRDDTAEVGPASRPRRTG